MYVRHRKKYPKPNCMKTTFTRRDSVLLFALMFTAVSVWRCSDSERAEPTPTDPDAIVEFDPTVGGMFEGGDTTKFPKDIEPEVALQTSYKDAETNSIATKVIAQLPEFGLDVFAQAYEEVVAEFPTLAVTSNEFAEKVMTKIRLNISGRTARVEGLDTWDRLTPEEKELVIKNPLKAYKSNEAAQKAMTTTAALFGTNGRKTRSDAFRHAYWNWLMSAACSVEWARAFATAHESGSPNDDERRMDLNNNIIGRRVYAGNPSASETDAQMVLLEYKLLWSNEQQKNVTVGIDYLVYLSPMHSLTVWDDGPSYDDIYDITYDGKLLGTTPAGGSKAFEFSQIPSGTYGLDIKCMLDGTQGGCGFQIKLEGALQLSSGLSQTPQIVIQESTSHGDKLTLPTLKEKRKD
jgi:hypothetical protein